VLIFIIIGVCPPVSAFSSHNSLEVITRECLYDLLSNIGTDVLIASFRNDD
jgi:hypothetical protein